MTRKLALVAAALAMIAGGVLTMGVTAAHADDTASPAPTSAPAPAAAADSTATTKMAPSAAPAASDAALASTVPDMTIGNPDAKVSVIEYASFTCPHCADFHAEVYPQIKKNYIDSGKIKFTMREVYFDKYGLWAGMMARCGGELRYFGIVDILFNTQRDWAASEDPNAVVAGLRKIGKTAGLTDAELDACMNDGKMAQAMVAKFQATTAADKIEGTPSFVIDGVTHTNMAYDDFAKILDAELAKTK